MNINETESVRNEEHAVIKAVRDKKGNLIGFIALHRFTSEKPAFGATRFWKYNNPTEALDDALRLSRLMSYKSALAGLSYGGGKGVLIATEEALHDKKKKHELLSSYLEAVNELGGCFITGSDIGVEQDDVTFMRTKSPHIVGTQCDPAYFTVLGIKSALDAVMQSLFGNTSLSGKSIAIQGLGKIGSGLLNHIYHPDIKIYVSDIDQEKVQMLQKNYPDIVPIETNAIHRVEADIFAPCAMGGILNHQTVGEINAAIIVGGANNQLASQEIGDMLYQRGIVYAPDYVVNTGGLVSVVDEYEHGSADTERITAKVSQVRETLAKILDESRAQKQGAHRVADTQGKAILDTFISPNR